MKSKQQLIAQGAEASIYKKDDTILKHRIKKSYRIEEIDERIRKSRTRREAKVLDKLHSMGFSCPSVIDVDDKTMELVIELIPGEKIRDVLTTKNYKTICKEIGEKVAFIHNNNVVHGDLTTSNMILKSKTKTTKRTGLKKDVFFIDFGLSYFSRKIEDKAVDLHLLKQALESKHYKIWEKAFKEITTSYTKKAKDAKEILARLDVVEGRGRYKGKG